MHEILARLPAGARVLDLGCRTGSFLPPPHLTVIRADLEPPAGSLAIACDAAAIPLRDRSIDAIICNHSLEHFDRLNNCIQEILRVLAPGGYLYIAVPDSSTFTDRLYRWLARGGGHVNPFADVHTIPSLIPLRLAGTRLLHTSLSFLNRDNRTAPPPRKLLLLANGNPTLLRWLTLFLRRVDRIFHTRASIYGWAYYFGDVPDFDASASTNVCIRCGSAHPAQTLHVSGRILPHYRCPHCATLNYFA